MNAEKLREVLGNLEEANKVIATLDPTIRIAAFEFLKPFIAGADAPPPSAHHPKQEAPAASKAHSLDSSSLEAFFGGLKDTKPADNVFAIMAWFYAQRGVIAVGIEEIKSLADKVGLTVPSRIDMTLTNGRREGKSIFKRIGSGFEPTVQGELYMKEQFGVKKGIAKQ